jgi:hypothetical protein
MNEAWEILELEGSGVVSIPVYPLRTLVVFIGFIGALVSALKMYVALMRPNNFKD